MDAHPRILGTANLIYAMDRHLTPAVEIDSGDTLAVQTLDARSGTVLSDDHLLDMPHPKGANPATGPIYVRRSQAVDSLIIEIVDIELADRGFLAIKKNVGLVRHHSGDYLTRIVPVRDGMVQFNDCIQFPVRPMVGVIGTAPAGKGVATSLMGPHGGNMDNRYVCPGAKVHLPIQVPGGLLALGDVHASMGDGEVTMVGLEIASTVTIRVHLDRGVRLMRPWIETDNEWVTTGDGSDVPKALREATDDMIHLLANRLYIKPEEAYMLVSARGDVQVCQASDPGEFPISARCVMPRLDRSPAGFDSGGER